MATGTSTTRPPILATTKPPRSRSVPPPKRPAKGSVIAAAMKSKRPR